MWNVSLAVLEEKACVIFTKVFSSLDNRKKKLTNGSEKENRKKSFWKTEIIRNKETLKGYILPWGKTPSSVFLSAFSRTVNLNQQVRAVNRFHRWRFWPNPGALLSLGQRVLYFCQRFLISGDVFYSLKLLYTFLIRFHLIVFIPDNPILLLQWRIFFSLSLS